jgi:hypothetical protein
VVEVILWILFYFACCYRAYWFLKPCLIISNRWTVGDRTLCIVLSLGGPISLFTVAFIRTIHTLADCHIWSKEARW